MTTMTETSARFREFKMPDVGEGLTEAEILKWFVQPGDTVTDGQVVCEVETAKAAVELPIPFDGVVHELRFAEGSTVDVGEVIIAVDVAPGSGARGTGAGPAGGGPAAAEAAGAPKRTRSRKGRQPVLVGYGVAECSTKRRARKRGRECRGRSPDRRDPGRDERPGGTRCGRARPAPAARRAPCPRAVRWPSRRCASWPRTWASTSPTVTPTGEGGDHHPRGRPRGCRTGAGPPVARRTAPRWPPRRRRARSVPWMRPAP